MHKLRREYQSIRGSSAQHIVLPKLDQVQSLQASNSEDEEEGAPGQVERPELAVRLDTQRFVGKRISAL